MSYTTLNRSEPTARKPHCCCYCERRIEVGDKYTRWTGIYDGDFISSAAHPKCLAFRQTMDLYEDEHPDPGEFVEEMEAAARIQQQAADAAESETK